MSSAREHYGGELLSHHCRKLQEKEQDIPDSKIVQELGTFSDMYILHLGTDNNNTNNGITFTLTRLNQKLNP